MIGTALRTNSSWKAITALATLVLALNLPSAVASGQRSGVCSQEAGHNTVYMMVHPSSARLSVGQILRAQIWLDSDEPGAVIVTTVIEFDKEHLEVRDVVPTSKFGTDISVTSVSDANRTGVLLIKQALTYYQAAVTGSEKIAEIDFRATLNTGSLSSNNIRFSTTRSCAASSEARWMSVVDYGARFEVGEPSSAVAVDSVVTTDEEGDPARAFSDGETIGLWTIATNHSGSTLPTEWSWRTYDSSWQKVPELSYEHWAHEMPPGTEAWGMEWSIPSDLSPGTYTLVGSVEQGSETSWRSLTFQVRGSGKAVVYLPLISNSP